MKIMQKVKKVILWFILAVIICFFVNIQVQAEEKQRYLSEMNGEECIAFLADSGVEIPADFQDYEGIEDFVKETITAVEKNPNISFNYNYTGTLDFVNRIKKAVNDYYGVTEQHTDFLLPLMKAASLQYSTIAEEWSPRFENYNCYAYAINKTGNGLISPGYFIGVNTGEGPNFSTITLSRMAVIATYDLQALGYKEITYGYSCPLYNPSYRVIALKKDAIDYHFMYLYSNGIWQHKPGISTILKYNYSSLTSGKWTNERSIRGAVQPANHEYKGDVMYIRYKL